MKHTKPNPNIQFSCIDVLLSYAYIMRLYNGCPDDTPHQAAESLMQLSAVLSQNPFFEIRESVVYNSLTVVQNSKELHSEALSHCALHDVINLIQGHDIAQRANFTDCALSDLCRCLSRVREKCDGQKSKKISHFCHMLNCILNVHAKVLNPCNFEKRGTNFLPPRMHFQISKSTLDSLKGKFNVLKRKPWFGALVFNISLLCRQNVGPWNAQCNIKFAIVPALVY